MPNPPILSHCLYGRWVRLAVLRTLWKLLLVAGLWFAFHNSHLRLRDHLADVATWLDGMSMASRILAFMAGSVVFTTFSPTGYLPTVLAGMAFPWGLAWLIAYLQVNLGAVPHPSPPSPRLPPKHVSAAQAEVAMPRVRTGLQPGAGEGLLQAGDRIGRQQPRGGTVAHTQEKW